MGARFPHTFEEVARLAVVAGFTGYQVVTMTAISKAESNHDAYAVGVVDNPAAPDSPSYRSLDVGLWQVNTYWWPNVPVAELLDPAGNARQARRVFTSRFDAAKGTWAERVKVAYSGWAVYKAGAHERHMPAAFQAAHAVGVVT